MTGNMHAIYEKKTLAELVAHLVVVLPLHALMALNDSTTPRSASKAAGLPILRTPCCVYTFFCSDMHAVTCHGGVLDRGDHHVPL